MKLSKRTVVIMAMLPVWFAVHAAYLHLDLGLNDCDSCAEWPKRLADDEKAMADPALPRDERFRLLNDAAKAAYEMGEFGSAEAYAKEVLALAPEFRADWSYGNAIHDAHVVLGRLALRRSDIEQARNELRLAGATPGSPQLNSFGPNMSLARDMLRHGQRDAVIEYLDACGRFWSSPHNDIETWKKLIGWRLRPNFGANLLY